MTYDFYCTQEFSDNAISNLLSLSFLLYLHIINYIFFLIKKIKKLVTCHFHKIQYITTCRFCNGSPSPLA